MKKSKIKPKGYWTEERILREALKYNTKRDLCLSANGPSIRYAARQLGIWKKITSHMVPINRPNGYWTRERTLKESLKYKTKSEFRKNSPGAYNAAVRENYKEILKRLKSSGRKPSGYWTEEKILKEAKKYKHRKDFLKYAPGAADAARRLGIYSRMVKHMVKPETKKWTEAKVRKVAKKYKVLSNFIANKPAYSAAQSLGVLPEVTKHMNRARVRDGYWNLKNLRKEAKKYKNKTEFRKGNLSAYNSAYKLGVMDKISKHMEPAGGYYGSKYLIYKIESKSLGLRYIGLTCQTLKKRKEDHLRSPTANSKKVLKAADAVFRTLETGLNRKEAGEREKYWTTRLNTKKYKTVNLAYGSLGGAPKWTKKAITKEALKYDNRSDFITKSAGAYSAAWKRGWLDEVCSHMNYLRKLKWTREDILKEAKKYKTRTSFWKEVPGAHRRATELGILDKACAHMKSIKKPNGYYNKKRVMKLASKFTKRSSFKNKHPSAYAAAQRNKWLDRIFVGVPKVKGGPKIKWTKRKVLKEASKYTYRTDFQYGSPGAHKAAIRLGILHRAYKHMEEKYLPNPAQKVKCLTTKKVYNTITECKKQEKIAFETLKKLLETGQPHPKTGKRYAYVEKD